MFLIVVNKIMKQSKKKAKKCTIGSMKPVHCTTELTFANNMVIMGSTETRSATQSIRAYIEELKKNSRYTQRKQKDYT